MIQSVFGFLFYVAASNGVEVVGKRFSCESRPSGYYADMNTGCQVYHMCDGLGRQFSYSCPNATLFQQRMLICDHWYMVNCSKSETDYAANLLIGQRDKPFLEDSEKHPYHRTPRPDLLQNSNDPNYSLVYRSGRSQFTSNFNLVGVETDDENNSSVITTPYPSYSLPSHWFTEYLESTTSQQTKEKTFNIRQDKFSKYNENNNKKLLVESFKTKVKSVPSPNTKYSDFQKKTESITQNPTVQQNPTKPAAMFEQASTQNQKTKLQKLRAPLPHIILGKVTPPSVYYQPPDIESHTVLDQTSLSNQTLSGDLKISATAKKPSVQETEHDEKWWTDLRTFFLIPDYEFPLDPISRPGYENAKNSFQINPTVSNSQQK